MNLSEMRELCMEQSDWSPDNKSYRDYVDKTINSAILEIWLMKPWLFTYRESELKLYPDIVGTGSGITLTVANMSRRIVSSGGLIRELGDEFYRDTWAGQVIELEGRDYPIVSTATSTSVTAIWLAEPYRSEDGGSLSSYEDWTIKHKYYRLPEDCVKLISFVHTDKPVVGASHQQAFHASLIPTGSSTVLNDDTSDYASHIFTMPDLQIPPAGKIQYSVFNSSDTEAIPDDTYLELAWSYYYAGSYGSLSESTGVFSVAQGGDPYNTVVVDCLDMRGELITVPTRNDPLDKPFRKWGEGLKKVLWFNMNIDQSTGARKGLPCWKMVCQYDPSGAQTEYLPVIAADTDYNLGVTYYGQLQTSETYNLILGHDVPQIEKRYIEHKTQQIQPYPRVTSADKTFSYEELDTDYYAPELPYKVAIIKYICKPYPIALDQDEIPLPSEFHNLLMYKALENIFNRKKDPAMSAFYSAKFNKELPSLERRFLQLRTNSISRQSRDSNHLNMFSHGTVRFI